MKTWLTQNIEHPRNTGQRIVLGRASHIKF
jgi:hypothetical protein